MMDKAALEAAWQAGAIALKEHVGNDMGPIQRTALMQVVVEAAIPAYLASLPSPGEAEPVAWEEVKQRAKNDCFLCCLAMAAGLSYEAATAKWGADFTEMVGAKGLYGRENIRFAFRALGLEFGVDYTSLLGAGDGVPPEFAAPARPMKALLWGRRAIVQVKSKNYEGQSHILYWDGDTIHDPSPLATYTWDETIPEHVWILRERASTPSERKVIEALKGLLVYTFEDDPGTLILSYDGTALARIDLDTEPGSALLKLEQELAALRASGGTP